MIETVTAYASNYWSIATHYASTYWYAPLALSLLLLALAFAIYNHAKIIKREAIIHERRAEDMRHKANIDYIHAMEMKEEADEEKFWITEERKKIDRKIDRLETLTDLHRETAERAKLAMYELNMAYSCLNNQKSGFQKSKKYLSSKIKKLEKATKTVMDNHKAGKLTSGDLQDLLHHARLALSAINAKPIPKELPEECHPEKRNDLLKKIANEMKQKRK